MTSKRLITGLSFICGLLFKTVECEKAQPSHITIRESVSSDVESYVKIAQLQEVRAQHFGTRYSASDNKKIVTNSWRNNQKNQILSCYKIHMILWKGEIVGYMAFFPDDNNPKIVYISYSVDPKYWNNGICTIAVKKLIDKYKIFFKQQGMEKIAATVKISNKGSIRVLQKNGFIIVRDIFCNNFPAKLLEFKI